MDQIREEWKPVVGYEGLYEVSNQGRVRSVHGTNGVAVGQLMKLRPNWCGYSRVSLRRDGKERDHKVHRLVAVAFLGPLPDGLVTNHIDADRTNNRIENLEYVTQSENIKHAVKIGTMHRGSRSGMSKLTEAQILEIREKLATATATGRQLAKEYGVAPATICRIKRGVCWGHVIAA